MSIALVQMWRWRPRFFLDLKWYWRSSGLCCAVLVNLAGIMYVCLCALRSAAAWHWCDHGRWLVRQVHVAAVGATPLPQAEGAHHVGDDPGDCLQVRLGVVSGCRRVLVYLPHIAVCTCHSIVYFIVVSEAQGVVGEGRTHLDDLE
jgi:hypothetical protein